MNNHVTGTANALVHDLNLARAEAVRRGTLVAVISNAGGWSNGWSVKADAAFAADGTFSATGDPVLSTNPGVATVSGYKVTAAVTTVPGTGITPTSSEIIFTGQGNLIPQAQKYNINVCHPDAQPTQSKWIVIAASGSITTQTDTSSSPAPSC
ncbi:MAG: GspH/FimT family protein [Rudaea sp.]